jgi:formate dehydrogenase subunit gamma
MAVVSAESRQTELLVRFDIVERVVHWCIAGLFGVLMVTAVDLYFGSIFGITLPRHTIAQIHLWCGLALPLPLIVGLAVPWGQRLRHDVRRVSRWTRAELTSLTSPGQPRFRRDKFNPGQKLNALFVAASIPIMLASGAVLQWFRLFPVDIRTNATFVHDSFALAIFIVVVGHIVMAITHPDALRSMFGGTVSRSWARKHARGWLDEIETAASSTSEASAPRRDVVHTE